MSTAVSPERMALMNGNGKPKGPKIELQIKAPNFQTAEFELVGTAPYVQNKFTKKAMEIMGEKQRAGDAGKNKKKRSPKDFKALYEACQHRMKDGSRGIPAAAFRSAMIDACRVAGLAMTMAKMTVFAVADGYDSEDGTPLVKITKGKPEYFETPVRNDSGVIDLRPRAKWDEGWKVTLRVQFDGDQFNATDVANLLMRAGKSVGVGEGRPFSRDSHGMGWGTFEVANS